MHINVHLLEIYYFILLVDNTADQIPLNLKFVSLFVGVWAFLIRNMIIPASALYLRPSALFEELRSYG